MTRTVVIIALTGLCISGRVRAQDAPAASATRIGMIDLAAVYEKNARFQSLKSRARKETSDFAKQCGELEETIASCKLAITTENLENDPRQMAISTINEARRRLCCDLPWEYAQTLNKLKQERIAVDREIDQAIGDFAAAHSFDLILSTKGPEIIDGLPALRRPFVTGTYPSETKVPAARDVTQGFLKYCCQSKQAAPAQ